MKILHLEDDPHDAELIRRVIVNEWTDCAVQLVSTRAAYETELLREPCDVILSDFSMSAFSGLEALALARQQRPDTPFVFLSGTIGEDRAVAALRAGARDYVLKDRMQRLVEAIRRVLRENEEHRQRLRAERLTREQADMLNQAREAIMITDLSDVVIYWNTGAERLYGWSAVEALGRRTAQLFSAQDELVAWQAAQAATRANGEWQGTMTLRPHRGTPLIVDLRQTLVRDETGRAKALLSISSDITEKCRLEEQLFRAQRLENIGLLAAGIAHDLNNMLAPIVMGVPLLRECVREPRALRVLAALESSADRGTSLVRQILSFAQGVGGELQVVQVKHLMRDLAQFIEATFPKDIRLELHLPSQLWPVKANPTHVHQVLLNLCINARDAMPRGGTLRLLAENCVLDGAAAQAIAGARPGNFLVVTVSDSGTGIDPAVLARIWEPFVTTKEAGKGTGLGLSTVRGIVQNLSGIIHVQTQLGEGSTFRIYLPAVESGTDAGAPARTELAQIPLGQGELILVVDDDKQIRDMIAALLTQHRYRALVAEDGSEAVLVFANHASEIRLVISDIQMPNLDGPTMARLLKRINPGLRMLIVTGGASAATMSEARQAVGRDMPLLRKPFDAVTLLTQVHAILHPA